MNIEALNFLYTGSSHYADLKQAVEELDVTESRLDALVPYVESSVLAFIKEVGASLVGNYLLECSALGPCFAEPSVLAITVLVREEQTAYTICWTFMFKVGVNQDIAKFEVSLNQ